MFSLGLLSGAFLPSGTIVGGVVEGLIGTAIFEDFSKNVLHDDSNGESIMDNAKIAVNADIKSPSLSHAYL